MSMDLFRLGLQFFAEGEDDDEGVPSSVGEPTPSPEGEGLVGAVTPIVPAAAPTAPTREQYGIDVGEMDEESYYAKYDLDPDRDYQNTVNTLNYEYQTSLANYGENAEKMYQMGLSNSGVSDIFGANAFSAYLGNMNQAAADRIAARKRNKAAFNDYVAGINKDFMTYEQDWKNTRTNTENTAFALAFGSYNGYNINEINSLLAANKYDQGIIDNVMARLSALDTTSIKSQSAIQLVDTIFNSLMPGFTGSPTDVATLKDMLGNTVNSDLLDEAIRMATARYNGSEDGQKAQFNSYVDQYYGSYDGTNIDAIDLIGIEDADMQTKVKEGIQQRFTANVAEIYNMIKGNYTPENADALKSDLQNSYPGKYNDAEINAAFTQAQDTYGKTAGGKAAAVNNFVTTWTASFDPNMSKEEFVNKMITKEDGTPDESQRANAEAAWEQMKADWDENIEAATRRAEELYRGATYTVTDENGNKVTKQYVKGVIEKLMKEGYSKAVANAAAQKLIGQDPTIYKERAGKQAYADAMSRLGIEGVDLTKYSSWDAYKTAITNSLQGTDWSVDSVNYAIQKAKNAWNDAKRSTVAGIVDYFAEQIKSGISESQIRKELKDAGYSKEFIDEGYTTYKNSASKDDLYFNRIDEIVDTEDIREVSLEEMYGQLGKGRSESVEISEDKGGGTFTDYIDDTRLRKHAATMLTKAINNISDLQSAWNLIGYDQLAWEELNDGEKILKILDAAGRYKKKGLITQGALESIYSDWIETELTEINNGGFNDQQKHQRLAELEGQLLTFIDSGYIERSTVETIIGNISNN